MKILCRQNLKDNMLSKKDYLKEFINSILAGGIIAIGGVLNLKFGGIAGAVLFSVGLFVILTRRLSLFTGKLCNINNTGPIELLVVWFGNLVGATMVAGLFIATRLVDLSSTAQTLIQVKADDLLSVFILGIFCEFMINVAVYPFKKSMSDLFKIVSLFFGVITFVLLGFEHSVANMFYSTFYLFTTGWSWSLVWIILISTVGNIVGAGIMYGVEVFNEKRHN